MSRTRKGKFQRLIVELTTTVENQERGILSAIFDLLKLAVTVANLKMVLATAVFEVNSML